MESTSDSSQMTAAVEQFCSFTGADESTARIALEACNWNLELAINMFVDQNDGQIEAQNRGSNPLTTNASTVDRTDRFESQSEPAVRPPIPPVRQVLVEDYPSASYSNHVRRGNSGSVFDAFRDFEQEARWTEQQMVNNTPVAETASASKRRTLEDLFRPPLDLICRGTLEYAKDEGNRHNKWLMVNVQNHQEFSCQVLNRDVWSNPAVKSIIKEHFIFWQTYHDNNEGQRFMQFYNVTTFPYIAILDPRTGEKLRNWSDVDSVSFCDLVTEFLHDCPTPSGSSDLPLGATATANDFNMEWKSNIDNKAIYEESEEMQLKAAIAASLQEVVKTTVISNANHHIVNDIEVDSDLETFDSDNEERNALSGSATTSKSLKKTEKSKTPPTETVTKNETKEVIEDYRTYLGPENGTKFELVVRYPDGNRENITFPSDTQLKALFLYVSSKGYDMKDYDLITNFPKKNLSQIDWCEGQTLESVGIHSRDVLYVQHKT